MLTNVELYFIHGWGFNHAVWKKWLPDLRQSITTNLFDRGYFKNKKHDFNFNFSSRSKILIAHSFGLHYLSAKDFSQIHMLILIGGFRQFHEYAENYKFSQKQIELMKQKLLLDPTNLLTDFYRNCGLENATPNSPLLNRELLYDDLVLLNTHQLDLDNLKSIPQILLLHGAKDTIVNAEHSRRLHEQLPHSKLFLNEKEGHALPLTDADWCINTIQSQFHKKLFANSAGITQDK